MATHSRFGNTTYIKDQNKRLTLAVLLDRKQPYTEIDQLDDPEITLSNDDCHYDLIRRMQGSLVGLAVGDALGASVEFRPNAYMKDHPVHDMQSGGTWGLEVGQWTDDTSMALCLAASLIVYGRSNLFDQFERYRKWYRDGYLSSTGKCFDIGKSTRDAITAFENRLQRARSQLQAQGRKRMDSDYVWMLEYETSKGDKGLKLGTAASAGNGPLMRLAPIPCFFSDSYNEMLKHVEDATQLTHGDPKATDACQFYAGLIWYALRGTPKEQLLGPSFYQETLKLNKLSREVQQIAAGSYKNKRKGYEDGIRGKGYVVNALEAALWAFENDDGDFNKGVLLAINLGDDTDTTAAIYGELAGAVYGIDKIRKDWVDRLFQEKFIKVIAKGLYIKGNGLESERQKSNWSNPPNRSSDNHKARETQGTALSPPSNPSDVVNVPINTSAADTATRIDRKTATETKQESSSTNPKGSSENGRTPNILSQN